MKDRKKVLVLGHEMRSTLSVIRSLGMAGVPVDLGIDDTQAALCKHSRYVAKTISFPPPVEDTHRFVDAFTEYLQSTRYALIIPTTDIFMIPLVKNREKIESVSRLAAPGDEAFNGAYDKFLTADIARSLGIPIPKGQKIVSFSELGPIPKLGEAPVVVKPRYSQVQINETIHHYKVQVIRKESEFGQVLQDYLCATPVLVQEFFVGTGVGVEVLCLEGDILAAFQHQRIHEPLRGGGSSYRKSVPLNPVLLDYTRRLMTRLKWTGVAMVEFLVDPSTGEGVLVEINGRFWGSLPLAIKAGVDFPWYLYQMLVEGRRSFPSEYLDDIYCRNIVNDLWWFYGNCRASSGDPYLKKKRLADLLKEAGSILSLREYNDTIDLRDPRPGLSEVKDFLKSVFALVRKRIQRGFYGFLEKSGWLDRWLGRKKRMSSIKGINRVLFLCKGNICRSPFAEKYLQERSGLSGYSAGYSPRVNRRPPDKALYVSQSFDIELSQHRSCLITRGALEHADVILVMDLENYLEVTHSFPWTKDKVMFLSWFRRKDGSLSIPDPFGFSLREFERVYRDIAQCIEGFLLFVERESS